jgi:tetratricopeptide (TPR) repeat protein
VRGEKREVRRPRLLFFSLLTFLFSLSVPAAQHAPHVVPVIPQDLLERPVTIRTGIGRAHDGVTTASAEAQGFYDQGLSYLHSFVWIEAARSFHQALRSDPGLALAHVGLSYAYIELNKPEDARRALERARALAPKVSDHERRHIEARSLQMAAEENPGDPNRLVAYRRFLDAAIAAFPSDVELMLKRGMAESPDPADRGQGSVAGSMPFFERALKVSLNHFAARHYMAHAAENSGRMGEALAHAVSFSAQASEIPHARHMHGHELRRSGRPAEAIAEFEAADRLQRAYFTREKVAPELDWHHHHNLDLLAASYQYVGQVRKAEPLLKQSFLLPSNLLAQVVNKREWPVFLLARNRPSEALDAARVLIAHPHPVVQATGHIEAGFALLATKRYGDAATESNAALKALRGARDGQALAVIALEALQGEFLLRTAQREKGRQGMERAAQKWRALPGPDAWSQSLFRLEAMARAARGRRLAVCGPAGSADARTRPRLRRDPLRARPGRRARRQHGHGPAGVRSRSEGVGHGRHRPPGTRHCAKAPLATKGRSGEAPPRGIVRRSLSFAGQMSLGALCAGAMDG